MSEDKIMNEKKHLKVVDLTDVIKKNKEESDKVPDEILKDIEMLLKASKENRLKSAIVFFEMEKDEEENKEEETKQESEEGESYPVLFFWHHRGVFSELYLTVNYIKDYIYNLCMKMRTGESED